MSLTLPFPDQQVTPQAANTGGHADPGAWGAVGGALEQGGAEIAQQGFREAEKQQQHDMAASVAVATAKARDAATQQFQQMKSQAQPGAPEFTPTYLKWLDGMIADTTKTMSPDAQPYMIERLSVLREHMGESALQFESAASLAKRQQDVDTTVNLNANTLRSDPSQFEQVLGDTLGAVAGSGIEPSSRKEAELHVKNVLAASTIEGMIDRSPGNAVKALNGGSYDAFLTPSAKNALLERATALQDRDARQGQAQFQASVSAGLKDEFASIEDRGQGTGNPAVSPANIKAAYGAQAPAVLQELDLARKGWNARAQVALTGPDEDAETLKAFAPSDTAGGGVPYAAQASERDSVIKAVQQKYKAFAADPAAYVQSASPALQAAMKAAETDPTKMPAAIALSDQLQAKIGGEPSAPSPHDIFVRNSKWVKQGAGSFTTQLAPAEEAKFQGWVKKNDVPFDPSVQSDYDMRGFFKALEAGDPRATTAVNKNDGQMHFPDVWKTPFHHSFSNESQWANDAAPHWTEDDKLVTATGTVVFDERASPPPSDFQPHVLSTVQAKGIAGKISAAPVDQAGPALQQLQAQYGDAWPRVWGDLQGKGKLPAAYQVLGTIDDPAARDNLAAALRSKDGELKKNVGGEAAKAVTAAVGEQLAPFYRTLSVVPNGDQQTAAYRDSAERLALHYVGQGLSPEEASGRAANDVATSRYDFATAPGYNARAPKDTLPLVERYAEHTLSTLKADDVKVPAAPGIDDTTARTVYFKDHVASGSQWVSQGDDRWMLLDSARKPVLLKSGQPVSFQVKDAIAAPPPAATEKDAQGNLHPAAKGPVFNWLYGQ